MEAIAHYFGFGEATLERVKGVLRSFSHFSILQKIRQLTMICGKNLIS